MRKNKDPRICHVGEESSMFLRNSAGAKSQEKKEGWTPASNLVTYFRELGRSEENDHWTASITREHRKTVEMTLSFQQMI